jgi:hypothetical protein
MVSGAGDQLLVPQWRSHLAREGQNREYFERCSPEGYAMGVNFILSAITR